MPRMTDRSPSTRRRPASAARRQPEATDPLDRPRVLLGGLSPRRFMARHWQRRPLMIPGAWPGVQPPITRAGLFELASRSEVQSRCIEQGGAAGWKLRQGPFARRALPPLSRPGWTLLVQGLDLHVDEAHRMLRAFDFIAQARMDDLMLSYASDGGGVGPHVDSYDVFLLQVSGCRRWRIAPPGSEARVPGLPLKILSRFKPEQEWLLKPGDMLYLPPGWGHDGVAEGGDCMTASIGFRAPTGAELMGALLARLGDEMAEEISGEIDMGATDEGHGARAPVSPWSRRYADPGLAASLDSGLIPSGLWEFTTAQVERLLRDRGALARALGSWLTEPHPQVWFEPRESDAGRSPDAGIELDRRSRMAHLPGFLFLNGEPYRVAGRDATLLQRLADQRMLSARDCSRLSAGAQDTLHGWWESGWVHEAWPPRERLAPHP